MKRNNTQSQLLWLGDTCFFPTKQVIDTDTLRFFFQNYKESFAKATRTRVGESAHLFYFQVLNYCKSKKIHTRSEIFDPWVSSLPQDILAQLQREVATSEIDPFKVVPELPYTGFGYVIEDSGLAVDFYNHLGMHRLFGVRQLGFMHDNVHRVLGFTTLTSEFTHSRGLHQLDVYAVMQRIIENNPCLYPERTVLLAAAISHDGRTPAGGDTTKLVNLDLFNEETNYKDYFKFPKWKFLMRKYKIDENQLYSIIQGEGLLGQVLDIADKIAYIARDSFMFMGRESHPYEERSPLFVEGRNLIKQDPYICDVWQYVKITNGKVTVENGQKLSNYLKLRAIMFKELYNQRESRFVEYMLSKRVIKYLFNHNEINLQELLKWPDFRLEEKIDNYFGVKLFSISFTHSKIYTFETEKEMQNAFLLFAKDRNFLPIVDDFKMVTTNAVKKFNVLLHGESVNFSLAYPKEAQEIEDIMNFGKGEWAIYLISLKDLRIPNYKYDLMRELTREA
jgi:HD superfamily phosphohydrolase